MDPSGEFGDSYEGNMMGICHSCSWMYQPVVRMFKFSAGFRSTSHGMRFDGDVVTGSKSPQRRSQCRRSWIRQLFHPASEVMGTFGMTRRTSSIVVEV